jgi:hypothetical protein
MSDEQVVGDDVEPTEELGQEASPPQDQEMSPLRAAQLRLMNLLFDTNTEHTVEQVIQVSDCIQRLHRQDLSDARILELGQWVVELNQRLTNLENQVRAMVAVKPGAPTKMQVVQAGQTAMKKQVQAQQQEVQGGPAEMVSVQIPGTGMVKMSPSAAARYAQGR